MALKIHYCIEQQTPAGRLARRPAVILGRLARRPIVQVTGAEITASIFFVYDGDISYSRGNLSWLGKWNTDRGVLTVSFEDSTINGTYNYKVKNQNQNTTASKPFDELELTPIEIDDSLLVNQFLGTFSSIY